MEGEGIKGVTCVVVALEGKRKRQGKKERKVSPSIK